MAEIQIVPLSRMFQKMDESTIQGVLDHVKGGFKVEKSEIFKKNKAGEYVLIEDEVSIGRADTEDHFKVMGSEYGIVQYSDALDFLDKFVGEGKAVFEGARLTARGARLHLWMRTPHYAEISPGDFLDCYFHVSTSHDGTGAVKFACTPVHRLSGVVMTPTGLGVVKIKHSKHVGQRLTKARQALTKVHDHFAKFPELFRQFATFPMDDTKTDVYLRMIVDGDSTRAINIRAKIVDIWRGQAGGNIVTRIPSAKGTLYGLMLAVQLWAEHYKTVRKSKRYPDEIDARIETRLSGDGAKTKAEALNACYKLQQQFSKGTI